MNPEELIGKTITGAKIQQLIGHDDKGYLVLSFSDGTTATVVGGYDEYYTGKSQEEYPTIIYITDTDFDLQDIND